MKMDDERKTPGESLLQHAKFVRAPREMRARVQRQAIANGGTHLGTSRYVSLAIPIKGSLCGVAMPVQGPIALLPTGGQTVGCQLKIQGRAP
jgi:hypothetical protein